MNMGKRIRNIFFNLEKRNRIRKHIQKLRLSGVITTDHFEILEAEKYFCQNLYKCRRHYFDENDQLSLEDLPIPTLSPESTYLGEGLISIEECTKVLNSFSLNKVPGNDGLPIEFYKTYWDFLGEPLVECFNKSFVKEK